jgi:hypothetical protein
MKKIILIISTFVAFYYCFRFGYIWTAYGHGGQLLGIPFAFIMLIATAIFFIAKTKTVKDKAFIFSIVYFLTLSAFSVTIEFIRATMKNYFDFLYLNPGGYVDKIFLVWLIAGIIVLFLLFRQIKTSQTTENN